jgi:hypothetical protein
MAWGQAIAQTVGGAGNDFGRAVDSNIGTALQIIQQKLMAQEVQQRIKESEFRMKQSGVPQGQLVSTPQGGTAAITYDPNTGQFGKPQQVIQGVPPVKPPKDLAQVLAEQYQTGDYEAAEKTLDEMHKVYEATHPKLAPKYTIKQNAAGEFEYIPVSPGVGEVSDTGVKGKMPKGKAAGEGAVGGEDPIMEAEAQRIMQGAPMSSVTTPSKAGRLLAYMAKRGYELPIPLTPSAQKVLEESSPTHDQVKELMGQFESMKGDNTAFKFLPQRLDYARGVYTPIGNANDTIANLELTRIVGAARVMKGASRSVKVLEIAMNHLPNVWKDSPMMIYSKLRNLDEALTKIEQDAIKFGRKGGIGGSSPVNPKKDDPLDVLP